MGPSLPWKLPTETVKRESVTQNKASLPTEDSTANLEEALHSTVDRSPDCLCISCSHFFGNPYPKCHTYAWGYFLSMEDSSAFPPLHTYNLSIVKFIQCYFIIGLLLFCGIPRKTQGLGHILFLLTLSYPDLSFQLPLIPPLSVISCSKLLEL